VRRQEAEVKSRELKGKVIQIEARGGDNGKLFGSITSMDIAEAIKEQTGEDIDRRKIVLSKPIKETGETEVELKLFQEVTAKIKVSIESDN
jgi:large subunit ribosomal protein L9